MDPDTEITPYCLVCRTTSDDVPLVTLAFQGANLWVCPQHLPILIHDPAQLVGILEAAGRMRPADHHD